MMCTQIVSGSETFGGSPKIRDRPSLNFAPPPKFENKHPFLNFGLPPTRHRLYTQSWWNARSDSIQLKEIYSYNGNRPKGKVECNKHHR